MGYCVDWSPDNHQAWVERFVLDSDYENYIDAKQILKEKEEQLFNACTRAIVRVLSQLD